MGFYEDELERSEKAEKSRGKSAILRKWKDLRMKPNSRGARSDFMIDPSLGFETSGLTVAVNQLPPGGYMASHRHGGEAIIYIVEGRGYTRIDDERFDWEDGDLIFISHWCWHQHFNTDPQRTATYIRFAVTESLFDIMNIILDPLLMLEHRAPWDGPDVKSIIWPEPH